jgi:hypothetical protein
MGIKNQPGGKQSGQTGRRQRECQHAKSKAVPGIPENTGQKFQGESVKIDESGEHA